MFDKILIANRGEIACRVAATARRLGIRTVAVYSDVDARALHVTLCDEAIRIGPAPPRESYLNGGAIIDAAKRSGAQAIHPGYGFLSENETFAADCARAGVVFIGPPPAAIAAMGSKSAAKAIMARAGVPIVPGYHDDDQDQALLAREAARIGFPVLIKATAGGGGKGMKVAASAAEFAGALASAQREAKASFGDDRMLIERYLRAPRHIEIQVFADTHGNVVHLFERDCSVQRRHQKVLEEAPAPGMDESRRRAMGDAATAAAKAIGYVGAGTVEFIAEQDGTFYFMEMNTRLQVEHPVTEAVTGLDLVELQLRVASGVPLGLRQEDIKFNGHAIEVRLCSEDAGRDFMPQSGRMALWQMPDGIRVEHALQSGAAIPPFYDSMIAKIIGHGADRNEARSRLICGLEQIAAFGVTTNQSFLISCLRHPGFARGEAATSFIGKHRGELLAADKGPDDEAPLAALLLYVTNPHAPPWRPGRSLAATFPFAVRIDFGRGVEEIEIVRERDGCYLAGRNGDRRRFEIDDLTGDTLRFLENGVMERARFLRDGDRLHILHRGITHSVRDLTLAPPAAAVANGGDGKVRAAMNGRVVAVLVKPGEKVTAGQPVMTLEAMKMEHVHTADVAGTVSTIDVAEGEQVTTGKIVVEIEAA
jgi:geranyl-CoA carboxylase alpha subunit